MTREEFNAKVIEQYKAFEEKEMAKSPAQIFNDAYEIAKMTALKDYLIETIDDDVKELYRYADTILDALYVYEFDYDVPMWLEWDEIVEMINDFVRENN